MDCRGTQLSQMLPPMSVKCAIAKFMMLMYELGVLNGAAASLLLQCIACYSSELMAL